MSWRFDRTGKYRTCAGVHTGAPRRAAGEWNAPARCSGRVVRQPGGRARRRGGQRLQRQSEVREDLRDYAGVGGGRHQAQPPAAIRAGEPVEGNGPAQQLGPGDVAGADVPRWGRARPAGGGAARRRGRARDRRQLFRPAKVIVADHATGRPRCARIFSITWRSVMVATRYRRPPQSGQASRSMAKVRRHRTAQATGRRGRPAPPGGARGVRSPVGDADGVSADGVVRSCGPAGAGGGRLPAQRRRARQRRRRRQLHDQPERRRSPRQRAPRPGTDRLGDPGSVHVRPPRRPAAHVSHRFTRQSDRPHPPGRPLDACILL